MKINQTTDKSIIITVQFIHHNIKKKEVGNADLKII